MKILYLIISKFFYIFRLNKISLLSYIDFHSRISKKVCIYRFCRIKNSVIGNYTYIGPKSNIHNTTIGKFCSIAANVTIGAGVHPTNFISTSPIFYSYSNALKEGWVKKNYFNEFQKVTIGSDVWIGYNCFICDGISIGDGAIIAAGSIVTKNVPPYAVFGGVPAKNIKMRFDEEKIRILTDLKWWDQTDNFLKKNIHFFNTETSLEKLCELVKQVKQNKG